MVGPDDDDDDDGGKEMHWQGTSPQPKKTVSCRHIINEGEEPILLSGGPAFVVEPKQLDDDDDISSRTLNLPNDNSDSCGDVGLLTAELGALCCWRRFYITNGVIVLLEKYIKYLIFLAKCKPRIIICCYGGGKS